MVFSLGNDSKGHWVGVDLRYIQCWGRSTGTDRCWVVQGWWINRTEWAGIWTEKGLGRGGQQPEPCDWMLDGLLCTWCLCFNIVINTLVHVFRKSERLWVLTFFLLSTSMTPFLFSPVWCYVPAHPHQWWGPRLSPARPLVFPAVVAGRAPQWTAPQPSPGQVLTHCNTPHSHHRSLGRNGLKTSSLGKFLVKALFQQWVHAIVCWMNIFSLDRLNVRVWSWETQVPGWYFSLEDSLRPCSGGGGRGGCVPLLLWRWLGAATTKQIMWLKYLSYEFVDESFKRHLFLLLLLVLFVCLFLECSSF